MAIVSKRKRSTAALAVVLAAAVGLGAYKGLSKIGSEKYFESVTQPIVQRLDKEEGSDGSASMGDIESTELLTGRLELFPYNGGDKIVMCFRGDLAPNGRDKSALHLYNGAGVYDYYAKLRCTVHRSGSREYELLLSAAGGFDPIYVDISDDGFSYPVYNGMQATEEQRQTVENNKDDILQLVADFEKELFPTS